MRQLGDCPNFRALHAKHGARNGTVPFRNANLSRSQPMVLRGLRVTMILAALLVAWNLVPDDTHQAFAQGLQRTSSDLFYNYYVPPGPSGGAGAQLYVCPVPTPPLVGHTYVTYQPLMPHEFLYQHCRMYRHYHPQSGWTRTMVIWQ